MIQLPMFSEIRSFLGGMIKDLLSVGVKRDQYIDAENIRLTDPSADTLGAITVPLGNELAFDLGTINFATNADDYTGLRIAFDVSTTGINHQFVVNSVSFTISSSAGSFVARYNDLVSKFIGQVGFIPITATKYIDDPSPSTTGVKYVGFKLSGGAYYDSTETITSTDYTIYTLKEFYGVAKNGDFALIKTVNIGSNLYVLSSNGFVTRVGVAVKDPLTSTWSYTIVFETGKYGIAANAVIDLDGEIDFNNRVSLYYTGVGYLPRLVYVTLENPWTTGYSFIWNEDPAFIVTGNTNGFFTHDNVEETTRIQAVENFARVSITPPNLPTVQVGGSLKTGEKSYVISQSIGDNTSTQWGLVSNPIPIFSDALTNTNLKGNVGGEPTNKSITLQIEGLNPILYNKFRLGVIENTDGVITASIVGTYNITVDPGGVQSVTHTGNEITTSLTITELLTEQIVIKSAGSLVINRNRLLLASVEIGFDPDLAAANADPSNNTITIERKAIQSVGADSARVGEYQDPINVYAYTGYMLNETYRFGRVFYLKDGRRTAPYFTADVTITYSGTADLTDNPGGTPDNIWVYYPNITLDLSSFPDIDGLAFVDACVGYSDVRLECIPEVLATGYIMPSTELYAPTNRYAVGQYLSVQLAITSPDRTIGGFLSPDVLFGHTSLSVVPGDLIYNYGQGTQYNELVGSRSIGGGHIESNYFYELSGDIGTPVTLTVEDGEMVQFNSSGVKFLNGYQFFGEIGDTNVYGNDSQQTLAIQVDANMNPITANFDRGFYLAQYVRPLTNKYGDATQGKYISCGNFKEINGVSTVSQDVFGGDTFTQKTITKFDNYGLEPVLGSQDVRRAGLSYYTQNRINTQMRYFTPSSTSFNYPYTTLSLNDWLSGPAIASSQDDPGQLAYSESYTPINNFQQLQVFDPTLPIETSQHNVAQYSNEKIVGSVGDPYRIFLPLNRKAYPAIYGGIQNMFRRENAIVLLCDNGALLQQMDQQAVEQSDDGISLILGNGTVLGAREQILSYFGCPIKTAAVQYIYDSTIPFIAWYSPNVKKLLRWGHDGVKDLGESYLLQSFFNDNNQFIGAEKSMVMGFDLYSKELMVSTNGNVTGATEWNDSSTYSEDDIVYRFTEPVLRCYFKAKLNVPANVLPEEPANQLQYWEPYRNSNYTLIFNEKVNAFGGFYSFKTTQFVPYENTFLTMNESTGVYEHNRGEYFVWYDTLNAYPYITTVVNQYPDEYKSMRNIWARCDNQPLYGHVFGINGTKTYIEQANFKQNGDRKYWWANVKNDSTLNRVYPGGVNTDGLNTLYTQRTSGETLQLRIYFSGINKMNEVLARYGLRPRSPRV